MEIDFKKYSDGLVPAIIQDNATDKVLMLGYMDEEAFLKTNQSKKVTFFSRSKQRLWTKGEESGNFLELVSIAVDCDNDALLIKVNPLGRFATKVLILAGRKIIFQVSDFFPNWKILFKIERKTLKMKIRMFLRFSEKGLIKLPRK